MHKTDNIFLPISIMKKTATIALFTISSLGLLQSQNTQISSKQLAGQLNTVTTMVPFLTITPDSRSAAMGDVGVALFNPDANSGSTLNAPRFLKIYEPILINITIIINKNQDIRFTITQSRLSRLSSTQISWVPN